LRKEIISSVVSDELTKLTWRLILLQMFTKQTWQMSVENRFCFKMFERKMIQTSVEPAEKSQLAVLVFIVQFANWQFGTNNLYINFSALHGASLGISFTYSFFDLV